MTSRIQKVFSFCILSFALFSAAAADTLTPKGCQVNTTLTFPGALARWYDYDDWDLTDYKELRFLAGGYYFHTFLTSISGVPDFTWKAGALGNNLPYGITHIPDQHWVMELAGHITSPQLGSTVLNWITPVQPLCSSVMD